MSEEFKLAIRDFVTEKFRKINNDYEIDTNISLGEGTYYYYF